MEHILIQKLTLLIAQYGYLAVFVFMTAESALIPIPSEVTMSFAGFLAGRGVLDFWLVVTIGAFSNLLGSLFAYYLGFYKGEKWIRKAIKKWGHYLLLEEKEYDLGRRWLRKRGFLVIFTSRLIPVIRAYISLPAGIAKMNVFQFSLYTFAGSLVWSASLAYLGFKFGENWLVIEPYFQRFQTAIIAGLAVLFLLFVWSRIKKKA